MVGGVGDDITRAVEKVASRMLMNARMEWVKGEIATDPLEC